MSLSRPARALLHPARQAREAVGLTRAQLAWHGRVSARTLSRYEREGADETAARRLATFLQIEANRRGLGLTIKMDIYLPDFTKPSRDRKKSS